MPYFPTLPASRVSQQVTDVFAGYNHNLKIGAGEFYDMKNLSSAHFPLLSNRAKRSTVARLEKPNGFIAKEELAYVDGTRLFYGTEELTGYLSAKGFAIEDSEKQLVSMGAYIVIFPDKLYINTQDYEDCGAIDAAFESTSNITYSICKADGTAYAEPTVGATAPESPENGSLWIDTSSPTHILRQYSAASAIWTEIATVYTKIRSEGIGASFAVYDGVSISGASAAGTEVEAQISALNGTKIIYDRGEDYIVVIGLLDKTHTQEKGSLSIRRHMPDMDFVIEAQNRLWGCKYGTVDGMSINEIYCCALGDFKNWNQFLGLSTDSYVASVGTDGAWTGAVTFLGYPIFFKENVLHKVYISSTGAHRITDTACRGVQAGSAKSLVVVNETLYYKGITDVCAYDGSLPMSVSAALGKEKYYEATAGSVGDKYYISMKDDEGRYRIFVLDTAHGVWHVEDEVHARFWAKRSGELYFISDNALLNVSGNIGEPEGDIEWSATTGLMGYETTEHKYVGRFNVRMNLPLNSTADAFIEYDSSGTWHFVGHAEGKGTGSFLFPVRPRRCDHFRIRLQGKGDIRVYSFAKMLERGSDL